MAPRIVIALALGLAAAGALPAHPYEKAVPEGRRLASCEDDPTWFRNGKQSRGCSWVAKRKTAYRCSLSDRGANGEVGDGVLASDACLVTCNTCPACDGGCCDSISWHKKRNPSKDCIWVSKGTPRNPTTKRCKWNSAEGVKAKEACRASCGRCDDYPACEGACCNSMSWKRRGFAHRNCDWVAAAPDVRCPLESEDGDDIFANDECPVACGSCPAPTANPTANPSAQPTAPPTANPSAQPTAPPTAEPTTPSPTLKPTVSQEDKKQCLRKEGPFADVTNVCAQCCPECLDYSDEFGEEFAQSRGAGPIEPTEDPNACICIDVQAFGYFNGATEDGRIYLTDASDCARVEGSWNWISAFGGNDTVVVEGDHSVIHGGKGNDALHVQGAYNHVYGDEGADDLSAEGNGNEIYGGEGDDELNAIGKYVTLDGGAGDDSLTGSGRGELYGGDGNGDVCKDVFGLPGSRDFSFLDERRLTSTCELCFEDEYRVDCETREREDPDPTPVPTLTNAPTPSPLTRAEKTECLRGEGRFAGTTDFCATCCWSCVTFESGTREFYENVVVGLGDRRRRLLDDPTACVCLDIELNDYGRLQFESGLHLTDNDDCVRIIGDENRVYGYGGDDHLIAIGRGNALHGGDGDDTIEAFGIYAQLDGGAGSDYLYADMNAWIMGGAGDDVLKSANKPWRYNYFGGQLNGGEDEDTCIVLQDPSRINFVSREYFPGYGKCETCFYASEEIDCLTRDALPSPSPTLSVSPSHSPTLTPAPTATGSPTAVLDIAERTACMAGVKQYARVKNYCATCCAQCVAFKETGSVSAEFDSTFLSLGGSPTTLPGDRCACLDLELNDYAQQLTIGLTDQDDCVRLVGDYHLVAAHRGSDAIAIVGKENRIYAGHGDYGIGYDSDDNHGILIGNLNLLYGEDGNDVFKAYGNRNRLYGDRGDDVLYTDGFQNSVDGGDGDDVLTADGRQSSIRPGIGNDVCTDLGDNFLGPAYGPERCETCYLDGADPVNCATRDALPSPSPSVSATPSQEPTLSPAPTGTGSPTVSLDVLERTECLLGAGKFERVSDYCATCCPQCLAYKESGTASNGFHEVFTSLDGPAQLQGDACACLDLELSDYNGPSIHLTDQDDCVRLKGDFNRVFAYDGSDAVAVVGSNNHIEGRSGADSVAVDGYWNEIYGGPGNDALSSTGYSNRLYGQADEDLLTASGAFNTVWGGDGADTLFTDGTRNWAHGDSGDDAITVAGSDGFILGGDDQDVCTDLGDNMFWYYGERRKLQYQYYNRNTCETCIKGGVPINCDTGSTFSPTVSMSPTSAPNFTPKPSSRPTHAPSWWYPAYD